MEIEETWDLEIKPKAGLLDLNLGEVWRYRDLLLLFVKRDFIAQYKQSILGPLWHFVQPIFTTAVFLLVFGRIARLPTDGIPSILFYLSGISLWNYFSVCLTTTSTTFITNASIFGKVYFPRIIMPLSVILSNSIRFAIQLSLLAAAIVWYVVNGYSFHFSVNMLFIPVLFVMLAGIALGLGIILSALTTKYRDLNILLTFSIQLIMYASPVAYSLSYIKNTTIIYFLRLNPLTSILEAFRYCLFGSGTFTHMDLIYSFCFMVVSIFAGLILFNRIEKTFMDTV